jgi:eukaryotic-like serine/threonine-protein kinase
MPCMGVPSRLGRYVVRRRLGSGGFATVWLAHDELLDAEVAVKVLADNWAHDQSVRDRFLEEGRFLRRVESEHVVQVHDVGELADGRPFLVLTYADRGTLADRLKNEPLALESAIGVVVQVGRGLRALHRRGLLHRDVKPANVLFRTTDDDGERAVLSDLGLGKALDEVSRITMPGGTPSYVAPEQAMGERLDQRADQYALGAVAYAALTGRSPHQVDGLGAAGRVAAPPPPSSLGFAVPDRVDAAILRALEPDREKRWADIESFTRELVGALDETTRDYVPREVAAVSTLPHLDPAADRPTAPAGVELAVRAEQTTPVPDVANAADGTATATGTADAADGTATATGTADAADGTATPAGDPGAAAKAAMDADPRAEPTGPKEAGTTKRPRLRRRWLVAALVLLLAGGGVGFSAQRYVSANQLVEVTGGGFTVRVPRPWSAGSIAEPVWHPPGSRPDGEDALRVSADGGWDDPNTGTAGVFLGVMPTGELANLPGHGSRCEVPESATSGERNGTIYRSQYSSDCGDNHSIVLERIAALPNGLLIRIQVQAPASERSLAWTVAESVAYTGTRQPR